LEKDSPLNEFNLNLEVASWRNPSKCAHLAPDREVLFCQELEVQFPGSI